MMIDRELQRLMLTRMADAFPAPWDSREFLEAIESERAYEANLAYLKGHGLIDVYLDVGLDGSIACGLPSITSRGLDFLAEDGGLGAILGVVTIKIHDESIRQLIGAHIDRMPGTEDEKSALRRVLRDVPAEASKTMIDRLVALGLEHLPGTLGSLHTWLTTIRL